MPLTPLTEAKDPHLRVAEAKLGYFTPRLRPRQTPPHEVRQRFRKLEMFCERVCTDAAGA